MKIYCITHEKMDFIEYLNLIPAGVGNRKFPSNYLDEKDGENISFKNRNYGEISFHYWFWKNRLNKCNPNEWFAICQYRRFFVTEKIEEIKNKEIDLDYLKTKLIYKPKAEWKNFDVILCEPINLEIKKKMKLFKRGFKSLMADPSIFFDKKKHSVKLHFDMFHGHGNLDKAIELLPRYEKEDFNKFVSQNTWFAPNSMFISNNKKLVDEFYKNLFEWLKKCEDVFGLQKTELYDVKRIYSFLTERYLPYWFQKYSKVCYSAWLFKDFTKVD